MTTVETIIVSLLVAAIVAALYRLGYDHGYGDALDFVDWALDHIDGLEETKDED